MFKNLPNSQIDLTFVQVYFICVHSLQNCSLHHICLKNFTHVVDTWMHCSLWHINFETYRIFESSQCFYSLVFERTGFDSQRRHNFLTVHQLVQFLLISEFDTLFVLTSLVEIEWYILLYIYMYVTYVFTKIIDLFKYHIVKMYEKHVKKETKRISMVWYVHKNIVTSHGLTEYR